MILPNLLPCRLLDASVLASRRIPAGDAVLVIPPAVQLTGISSDPSGLSLLREESQAVSKDMNFVRSQLFALINSVDGVSGDCRGSKANQLPVPPSQTIQG